MTTAVYNRQSPGRNAGILTHSSIGERIESEATPEELSQVVVSLASLITASAAPARSGARCEERREVNEYFLNKYGDSCALCDELGFERSHLGPRADLNHIF